MTARDEFPYMALRYQGDTGTVDRRMAQHERMCDEIDRLRSELDRSQVELERCEQINDRLRRRCDDAIGELRRYRTAIKAGRRLQEETR